MPLPLWTLLWLNVRAGFRRLWRQARTVKGAVLVVAGLALAGGWVAAITVSGRFGPPPDPAAGRVLLPAIVLALCLLNVLSSAGDRAVSFSPGEVGFLFPGPFTSRQLLTYKLVKTGLQAMVSALIFAVFLRRYGGWYLGRVVAAWLTLQFIQLVAMLVAFAGGAVGERSATAGRRWAWAAVLGVAMVAVYPAVKRYGAANPGEVVQHLNQSRAGRAVLLPFGVFARAISAPRAWPEAVTWDGAAAAIDLLLVGVVLGLDTGALETAAAASERRHARVAKLRTGGLAGGKATSARVRLAMLPWLGGAGPIAWRQLTSVVRTSRGLLSVLAFIAVGVSGLVGKAEGTLRGAGLVAGGCVYVSLFLTAMLKFDFRGDVDQIDGLRALPIRPTAVAAAELVAPTAVMSAVQGVVLAGAAVAGRVPLAWVAAAATFVVPLNLLLVGSDNLTFLLFPYRQAGAVAGDMGMAGRQTIVFLCRGLALLAAAVVAGTCGALAFLGLHRSLAAGVAVAWVVMAAIVSGVVVLTGVAFSRFDPSVDTPT